MRAAVDREDEAGPRGHFAHIARQQGATGHFRQHDVELAREADRERLVVPSGGLFAVDVLVEPDHLVARELPRKPHDDKPLEAAPDVEDVARLIPARLGDGGAAVAPHLDEPFGGELAKSVAHQSPADPEALADRVFRQLGAGLQRLLDDGVAQCAVDRGRACTADLGGVLGHGRSSWLALAYTLHRVRRALPMSDAINARCAGLGSDWALPWRRADPKATRLCPDMIVSAHRLTCQSDSR